MPFPRVLALSEMGTASFELKYWSLFLQTITITAYSASVQVLMSVNMYIYISLFGFLPLYNDISLKVNAIVRLEIELKYCDVECQPLHRLTPDR